MRNKSHIFIIIVCNFFAFFVHGMKPGDISFIEEKQVRNYLQTQENKKRVETTEKKSQQVKLSLPPKTSSSREETILKDINCINRILGLNFVIVPESTSALIKNYSLALQNKDQIRLAETLESISLNELFKIFTLKPLDFYELYSERDKVCINNFQSYLIQSFATLIGIGNKEIIQKFMSTKNNHKTEKILSCIIPELFKEGMYLTISGNFSNKKNIWFQLLIKIKNPITQKQILDNFQVVLQKEKIKNPQAIVKSIKELAEQEIDFNENLINQDSPLKKFTNNQQKWNDLIKEYLIIHNIRSSLSDRKKAEVDFIAQLSLFNAEELKKIILFKDTNNIVHEFQKYIVETLSKDLLEKNTNESMEKIITLIETVLNDKELIRHNDLIIEMLQPFSLKTIKNDIGQEINNPLGLSYLIFDVLDRCLEKNNIIFFNNFFNTTDQFDAYSEENTLLFSLLSKLKNIDKQVFTQTLQEIENIFKNTSYGSIDKNAFIKKLDLIKNNNDQTKSKNVLPYQKFKKMNMFARLHFKFELWHQKIKTKSWYPYIRPTGITTGGIITFLLLFKIIHSNWLKIQNLPVFFKNKPSS